MQNELIRAHLNLYAVLQNLEDLVRLDGEMAALTRAWDVSIEFAVRGGPSAHLVFKDGVCRHERGHCDRPVVTLFFLSPAHLNKMFDGKANPLPLKGFSRLGFLKSEFSKLTDRLTFYLKPDSSPGAAHGSPPAGASYRDGKCEMTAPSSSPLPGPSLPGPEYVRINTILTLYTAVYAVKELAELETVSRQVAAHIPKGVLQIDVLPDGPEAFLDFSGQDIVAGKRKIERPSARMTFKDMGVANELLSGRLDAFLAVAEGKVMLAGQLPLIDSVGLILDRIPLYLE